AVALALIVGSGLALWQAHRANLAARAAEAQRDLYRAEAAHMQAVLHYLGVTLGQARQSVDGKPEDLHAVLKRSLDQIEQRYAADKREQAGLLRFAGELYAELFDDE